MWLKLKVGSPAKRAPSGSISCLATRAVSWRSSSVRSSPPTSSSTAPPLNDLPDDRGGLDQGALAGLEPVEPGRQQGVDRGRDLCVALLEQHPHQLLHEQRIALGGREYALGEIGGRAGVADQLLDQRPARLGAERVQLQLGGGGYRAAEVGPDVEQVGPGGGDDQDRHALGLAGEVLDQLEEGRLGPVDVLEQDHERLLAGGCLEQLADRPERLGRVGGGLRLAERTSHALDDRGRVLVVLQQPRDPGLRLLGALVVRGAHEALDDRAQRPEGEALAVGEAAAGHDLGLAAQRGPEVLRQARLADPGRADDRDQLAAAPRDRAVEGLAHAGPARARGRPAARRGAESRSACPSATSTRRKAGTGSLLPFSSSGGTGSTTTESRTRSSVRSPIRISSGGAVCSRRAATLTASPLTKPSPREGSPVITSPVLTPVRACSRTPQRSSSWSLSSARVLRISAAARTARSASSSRTVGVPKTAMTASPMNFSIAPSWRSSASLIASK